MSDRTSKQMNFGDYCRIEQKRYGVPNEMYQYKVVGRLISSAWVDVPVDARVANGGEVNHFAMEEVIAAICCGVSEREVLRFRAVDCIPDATTGRVEHLERAMRRALLQVCGDHSWQEILSEALQSPDEAEPPIPHDTEETGLYTVAQAIHLAERWRAGKLIGGDQDQVMFTLLREIERLRGSPEETSDRCMR
jgi:hypothetical protein